MFRRGRLYWSTMLTYVVITSSRSTAIVFKIGRWIGDRRYTIMKDVDKYRRKKENRDLDPNWNSTPTDLKVWILPSQPIDLWNTRLQIKWIFSSFTFLFFLKRSSPLRIYIIFKMCTVMTSILLSIRSQVITRV